MALRSRTDAPKCTTTVIRRNARASCAPGGQIVIIGSTVALVVLTEEFYLLIEELHKARAAAIAQLTQATVQLKEQAS